MTTLDVVGSGGRGQPQPSRPSRPSRLPRGAGLLRRWRPSGLSGLARGLGQLLAVGVPVTLLATFITYGMTALTDSNPAATVLGDLATPQDIERMNHQFGLDRPFLVQYVSWLGNALTGDLGYSYFTTLPVRDSVAQALPVDLSITLVAAVVAILVGGVTGIAAALNNGGRLDRAVTAVCAVASTIPPFVVGIGLIILFAVTVPVLPSGGYVPISEDPGRWLKFVILPGVALSVEFGAELTRQIRTSLVGTLRENFVTGATVRGLSVRRVVFGHALRNAVGPALTVVGLYVPRLIGGAVVAEAVFNLPGLGQQALQAAERGDIPVIQGVLVTSIALVLVCNVAVNVALVRLRPAAERRS
ncbi:ABC transporter permease [Parafrankia sp. EUN1f]|uniref:ABC transporter permease n=1 Tax=Parafrankia sp. EUN1f TaxID=102897 RepID=UPI0001C45F67|nr:ABC transporter permease [Parafrankia sp. EUN1f]EFC81546.1 binding-protein-dependent transport systems inner membrane component [Parafrankia sp. EUN1f]